MEKRRAIVKNGVGDMVDKGGVLHEEEEVWCERK